MKHMNLTILCNIAFVSARPSKAKKRDQINIIEHSYPGTLALRIIGNRDEAALNGR